MLEIKLGKRLRRLDAGMQQQQLSLNAANPANVSIFKTSNDNIDNDNHDNNAENHYHKRKQDRTKLYVAAASLIIDIIF